MDIVIRAELGFLNLPNPPGGRSISIYPNYDRALGKR